MRRVVHAAAVAIATVVASAGGLAAPPDGSGPAAEIDALVAAVDASGCEFRRNGRWHAAAEARAHLQRKLEWARRRGLAGTAEQFIERAATRSSISGRPYLVRCADGYEGASADWFGRELERLRQSNFSQSPR